MDHALSNDVVLHIPSNELRKEGDLVVVVVVVVGINYMHPSTTGRFLVAIGYAVPSPRPRTFNVLEIIVYLNV